MEKELICICCPIGCHLKVNVENKKVTGNNCKRGETYGIDEITNPVRIITTTVKILNGELPVISVKTKLAIPKALTFKAMEAINDLTLEAPIKIGDIILENLLETGVDVVATKTVKKA